MLLGTRRGTELVTMMRWRLRAYSLFPLFTGQHGLISVKTNLILLNRCNAGMSDPINSYSVRSISYIRTLASSKLHPKRSLHSSSDSDDDFAELGSPMGQGVGTILKLMTEKPEPFRQKTDSPRKKSSASSPPLEGSPSLKDASLKPSNSSGALHRKLENHNDASRYDVVNKAASNFRSMNSITIENVPSIIPLSKLKLAILTFGKISKASRRMVPNGLDCCDVEFESVESSRRAISAGRITIKNFDLPICPLHVRETLIIRISNICSETADSAIHSMCMSYGPLEGLVRTKEDTVDALFSVMDKSDTRCILKKLNNTIVDDWKWSAVLEHKESTPVAMNNSDTSQCQLGLQISSQIDDLKTQLCVKRMYLEDLDYLHHALIHLEHHPQHQ